MRKFYIVIFIYLTSAISAVCGCEANYHATQASTLKIINL